MHKTQTGHYAVAGAAAVAFAPNPYYGRDESNFSYSYINVLCPEIA